MSGPKKGSHRRVDCDRMSCRNDVAFYEAQSREYRARIDLLERGATYAADQLQTSATLMDIGLKPSRARLQALASGLLAMVASGETGKVRDGANSERVGPGGVSDHSESMG